MQHWCLCRDSRAIEVIGAIYAIPPAGASESSRAISVRILQPQMLVRRKSKSCCKVISRTFSLDHFLAGRGDNYGDTVTDCLILRIVPARPPARDAGSLAGAEISACSGDSLR